MTAAAQIPRPDAIRAVAAAPEHSAEFRRRFSSISRQSAVYFAGTMFTAAAGYFFKVYLARALGSEALGIYALGMSVVGLVAVFISMGLPAAAARFVAEYNARGELRQLGGFLRDSLKLLCAGNLLLCLALMLIGPWIARHFYHSASLARNFWLFVPIMFFGVLNLFLGQIMAGYQDVARRTLITHFVGTPANILIALMLISAGFGLKGYLAAQSASAFLVLILIGFAVWKMTPQAALWAGGNRLDKSVLAFSAVALASSSVDFVVAQTDKIVLGYYLDAAQVGVYVLAMSLVAFVPIALLSVNQIFSPTIAELHSIGDHALLQQLFATITKWVVVLTVPMALTLAIFSRPLMAIFGSAFEAGSTVLVIGTLGQLFNCAVGPAGYALIMSGRQLKFMKIQSCSAALMLALSAALVPRFGMAGAAAASSVGIAVTNAWALREVVRKLKLFPYNRSYLKLLPAAAVSFSVLEIVLHRLSPASSPWIAALSGLTCAYISFLGTLAFCGLDPDDRKIVRLALNKLGFPPRRMESLADEYL